MTEKDCLSIPDAARICDVGRTTMWRWVKLGKIKSSLTPGGHHRIRKADLREMLSVNHVYRVPEVGSASQSGTLEPSPAGKGKILIMDDEEAFRRLMEQALSKHGYVTEEAAGGFEAGLQVLEFQPDLVLLDLMMPGLDGFLSKARRARPSPGCDRNLAAGK